VGKGVGITSTPREEHNVLDRISSWRKAERLRRGDGLGRKKQHLNPKVRAVQKLVLAVPQRASTLVGDAGKRLCVPNRPKKFGRWNKARLAKPV